MALTVIAYIVVSQGLFAGKTATYGILIIAVAQMIVQLVFFLHLGSKDAGGNRLMLSMTVSIILIVVIGSIWIMNNLNYRMMTGQQLDQQMIEMEGIKH